jgi:hypothetical protein
MSDEATSEADTGRIPIEQALPGMALHPIDEDPDFAFVLVRTRDEEGKVGWCYRTTAAPNREELLGALMVQVAILKRELRDEWED